MVFIDKERLYKCPLCRGKLYAHSIMGMNTTESCYCPECGIVRDYIMSELYLCDRCYSTSFYKKGNKHYCWFCNNDKFITANIDEMDKFINQDGFKLSMIMNYKDIYKDNECSHNHIKNVRYSDTMFKITCKDCGRIEYMYIPKWIQEEHNGDITEILEVL